MTQVGQYEAKCIEYIDLNLLLSLTLCQSLITPLKY